MVRHVNMCGFIRGLVSTIMNKEELVRTGLVVSKECIGCANRSDPELDQRASLMGRSCRETSDRITLILILFGHPEFNRPIALI